MRGRDFLNLARELVQGSTEAHWRGAVIHAYYAPMLESREALLGWGRPVPPRQNVHHHVRSTFVFASDVDLGTIAKALDDLGRARNHASYNLNPLTVFVSNVRPLALVQYGVNALALLDAILADPAREAAAQASLLPPPP